jgi:hypothetical protein
MLKDVRDDGMPIFMKRLKWPFTQHGHPYLIVEAFRVKRDGEIFGI